MGKQSEASLWCIHWALLWQVLLLDWIPPSHSQHSFFIFAFNSLGDPSLNLLLLSLASLSYAVLFGVFHPVYKKWYCNILEFPQSGWSFSCYTVCEWWKPGWCDIHFYWCCFHHICWYCTLSCIPGCNLPVCLHVAWRCVRSCLLEAKGGHPFASLYIGVRIILSFFVVFFVVCTWVS